MGSAGRDPANSSAALAVAAEEVDIELALRRGGQGIDLLCPDDASYPLLLRNIPDPPNVLYFRGSLEAARSECRGDRRQPAAARHYGREQAERFGALLAGVGITVVSGGARGVDSAAHRGAIAHPHGARSRSWACGVDVTYPPENASALRADRRARRGAERISTGHAAHKENFPRRNRIVSGISRGVLIIEADDAAAR